MDGPIVLEFFQIDPETDDKAVHLSIAFPAHHEEPHFLVPKITSLSNCGMCGTRLVSTALGGLLGGSCDSCGLLFRFNEGSEPTYRWQPHAFDLGTCLARYNEKHSTNIADEAAKGWRVCTPDMRTSGHVAFEAAGRSIDVKFDFQPHVAH